jgi:hypothetical protein
MIMVVVTTASIHFIAFIVSLLLVLRILPDCSNSIMLA